jgi:hypothetical protein
MLDWANSYGDVRWRSSSVGWSATISRVGDPIDLVIIEVGRSVAHRGLVDLEQCGD